MTTNLHKEFVKKWIKDWCYMDADGKEMPGSVWSFISKALTSEYKRGALMQLKLDANTIVDARKEERNRGYKDGILMGHFEEAEDKVWYVKQAEKRGYKRGREEGINELMKKIRNKLVETKPMHDRRYEGNYEIEVFDGGFYWMKGRAEGILDEVLDTLKPKKNE
jgi:hypothetical protein